MTLTRVEILPGSQALELDWTDGGHARFHAIWLRDNALDAETRSPANGQRLITVLDIPKDNTLSDAVITDDGGLRIIIAPELKELQFSGDWLKRHIYDLEPPQTLGHLDPTVDIWNCRLTNQFPTGNWEDIRQSKPALRNWLADIQKYGVALLTGLPTTSGAVCDVAEIFGYVRETNYGRWFEVRSEVNPSNLAYTNLGLQAHTDNPYRDPVPTLQLLACLENSVEGGDSIVVDGFAAALRLKSEYPEAFDILSQYRADFEYAGASDVQLRARKPMIELAPDGEITGIRFNNRSTAPLTHVPFEKMEAYYDAYRRFAVLVEDEQMQVGFRLSPGELFIVDNTRVMHARKAFSGTGTRWLQGCYADKDGLLSKLRGLEKQPDH